MADLVKAVSTATAKGSSVVSIEDVFLTNVRTGTGATVNVATPFDTTDASTLCWTKARTTTTNNKLIDSTRGATLSLESNTTAAEATESTGLTAFTSTGVTFGADADYNASGQDFVDWIMKDAPRFKSTIKYTGNGVAGREIAHDLGVAPGMIITKRTDSATNGDWWVYHKGVGNANAGFINSTTDFGSEPDIWSSTDPTSTTFTLGRNARIDHNNINTGTYIAYLFADDPLGASGDGSDGMIACGSYVGNGLVDGTEVDLGWEPQYLLIKKSSSSGSDWGIFDVQRGIVTGLYDDSTLFANLSAAEANNIIYFNGIKSRGFKLGANSYQVNSSGETYIYMAIRRPMKTPESSSEVFAVDTGNSSYGCFDSGFPVDMGVYTEPSTGDTNRCTARLIGDKFLITDSTAAEASDSTRYAWDLMESYYNNRGATYYSWMWKRAPGFFDVVCYEGTGVAGRTVDHNLGVVPEMIWVKSRTSANYGSVYHKDLGATKYLNMFRPTDYAAFTGISEWNDTEPTDNVFTVGTGLTNIVSQDMIAFLFATLAGISKVGSYTGNGTSQTIDCGFSVGAKFVMIKATSTTGDWFIWDSTRGIVAGNDPHLSLNTTAAEVTTDDSIDPDSSGFIVNQVAATNINVSSAEYIFYAIAE